MHNFLNFIKNTTIIISINVIITLILLSTVYKQTQIDNKIENYKSFFTVRNDIINNWKLTHVDSSIIMNNDTTKIFTRFYKKVK